MKAASNLDPASPVVNRLLLRLAREAVVVELFGEPYSAEWDAVQLSWGDQLDKEQGLGYLLADNPGMAPEKLLPEEARGIGKRAGAMADALIKKEDEAKSKAKGHA